MVAAHAMSGCVLCAYVHGVKILLFGLGDLIRAHFGDFINGILSAFPDQAHHVFPGKKEHCTR